MAYYQNYGGTSGNYTIGGSVDTSIVHSGTKGMKWGVRRYQNADGSLTALGREHYGYGKRSFGDVAKNAGRKVGSFVRNRWENHNIKKTYGRSALKVLKKNKMAGKRLSEMTDTEIRKRVERLNLENQLLSGLRQKSKTVIDMQNDRANRSTMMSRWGHDLLKTGMTEAIRQYGNYKSQVNKEYAKEWAKYDVDIQKQKDKKQVDKQNKKEGLEKQKKLEKEKKAEAAENAKKESEAAEKAKKEEAGRKAAAEGFAKFHAERSAEREAARAAEKRKEAEEYAREKAERKAEAQRAKAERREREEQMARERAAEERHRESERKAKEFFKAYAEKRGGNPNNVSSMFIALPSGEPIPLKNIFLNPDDYNVS